MLRCLISNKQQIIIIVIALLFFGIGMTLRTQWRVDYNFWQDENHQINQIPSSLSAIMHARFDIQFSGDNILLSPFYKVFGKNKWGLAIPHIMVTLLGFYLFYLLCRTYFRTIGGYLIAFSLFAYNYNLIKHAFELRPYSVLVTLSMASFLICKYIIENEKPPIIIRILVCLFIFIASFFHLWSAYSLFFNYAFHLLMSRKNKSIRSVLYSHAKYYGITIIIIIPLLWKVLSVPHYSWGSVPETFEFIHKGIIPIAKGVFGNITGPRIFYPLLIGLIISFFVPHKERIKQIMFFMVLIVIPVAGLLMLCIIHPYWFIQRHFIWTVPLFAFFLGWCWDSIIIYAMGKFQRPKKVLENMGEEE